MAEQYRPSLPSKPQDGLELNYFSIDTENVRAIRLRYHVATKWGDIGKGKGADLVDQWQVFVDGYFSGRMDGWERPTTIKHDAHFATRQEAVTALCALFENRATDLEEQARELRNEATRVREQSNDSEGQPANVAEPPPIMEHCSWCEKDYDFTRQSIHCPHDEKVTASASAASQEAPERVYVPLPFAGLCSRVDRPDLPQAVYVRDSLAPSAACPEHGTEFISQPVCTAPVEGSVGGYCGRPVSAAWDGLATALLNLADEHEGKPCWCDFDGGGGEEIPEGYHQEECIAATVAITEFQRRKAGGE
jgi:hypothetical protein